MMFVLVSFPDLPYVRIAEFSPCAFCLFPVSATGKNRRRYGCMVEGSLALFNLFFLFVPPKMRLMFEAGRICSNGKVYSPFLSLPLLEGEGRRVWFCFLVGYWRAMLN